MKRTIHSFGEYIQNWLYMANSTHRHWWNGQINSGKHLREYLKAKYDRYCKRYEA